MGPVIYLAIGAALLLSIGIFKLSSSGIATSRAVNGLRKHRVSTLSAMRQAAEIARLNSELKSGQSSSLDWRVMEVAEIVEESQDCRSFYLVDPYRQPLPDFRPGQYLMVRPAIAGAYQTTRCYSLSSSPNQNYWRITVKRQEFDGSDDRKPQNGGLSKWMHRTIHEGDCLLIGGPNGEFYLPRESRTPLVLMAAGVGITPMASMLRWSLEKTPNRKVVLLYQVKDFDHWPLGKALHSWQREYPNIEVITFCSRASEDDIGDMAGMTAGRFVKGKFDFTNAYKVLNDIEDCNYYMCGPDPWMQSIKDGLVSMGVDADRVHWESFGGTGAQPKTVAAGDAEAVAVRFDNSEVDAEWSDPEQTLWELARESQVEIPSGCLSGVCGCCRVKLLKGKVEYDREIKIDLAENECLTCVTRPRGEVVLDA
ncbi:MAG: 2Fe-2S iron-sulfur cluster-binding protein [Planctomycetota bacterium]